MEFVETSRFNLSRAAHLSGDEEFRVLQNDLVANPNRGDVIPGCGGVRKYRFADRRRGEGKRGGLRVIYVYVEEHDVILFLGLYGKDEATDLLPEQKKAVAHLAGQFREEVGKKREIR